MTTFHLAPRPASIRAGVLAALTLLATSFALTACGGGDADMSTIAAVEPPAAVGAPPAAASTIAAGGSATFATKSDGALWSWGTDNGGVLGRADARSTPQALSTLSNVRSVASGAWYAVALLGNGDVYAWGWGDNVGAAIGSVEQDNPMPVKVASLSGVTAIATRYNHTLALDAAGKVYGFGPEGAGAIGPLMGNRGVRVIDGLADVRQIAAGEAHSLALLGDGTVFAWGNNGAGQLGRPLDDASHPVPAAVTGLTDVIAIAASSFGSFALRRDGTVWSWGQSFMLGRTGAFDTPAAIPGLVGATSIAAGNYNAFALDTSGAVFGWGSNAGGRVGVGSASDAVAVPTRLDGLPPAVQIAGGEGVGLALTRDGRVFAWGGNGNLVLDGTERADSNVPIDTGFVR